MTIYPDCDMNRWETSNSDGCILANADNYYTKAQVDKKFDNYSGVTIEDVDEIVDKAVSGKVDASSLAEVATSGDYDDLTNKPTIPTVPTDVSAFNNDAGYITEDALNGYATEEWVSGFTYDKETIEEKIASGGSFDPSNYYTTAQTDSLLDEKLDASAYTPTDLSDYYTKEETNAQISSATSGKADASAVTAEISAAVSGKVDTSTYTAYTASTDTAIGNKADASAFTAHTADTTIHVTSSDKETWNAKADISDIPSVSGYADSVKYNSTTHYVEFYHGGTGGTKVFEYDASPFIIDGMVENVEIKDVTLSGQSVTCLVVSFNTDAGKQNINIPISEIFNASNYYTKSEVDSAISAATDDMATQTWVGQQGYITGVDLSDYATTDYVDGSVSGKVSTSDFTAFTASTDTALGNKQDTSGMTAYTEVSDFSAHTANTNIHVTSEEKSAWNAKSDFSGSYNDLTDKPTIPTSASQLTNDAGYATSGYVDSVVSGKADSSAVTAEISAAVSGKADNSDVQAISGTVTTHTADTTIHVTSSDKSTWSGKQDALVSGTNIKTINNESILGSGNITIQGGGGGNATVELTQAEYDALVSAGTVSADTYYIITDAQSPDISQYWTSAQTQSAINAATSGLQETLVSGTNIKTINNESILGSGNITIQGGIDSGTVQTMIDESISGKVNTSSVVSAVTSASTDSEIPTAKAVYDAIPTGGTGGGKAISAGTNISVTTGETADTVSCTLPIESNNKNGISMGGKMSNFGTNLGRDTLSVGDINKISGNSDCSIIVGYNCILDGDAAMCVGWNSTASGDSAICIGSATKANARFSFVQGNNCNANSEGSFAAGINVNANNYTEHSVGRYNVSNTGSTDAEKTLFSVGNGTSGSARHNALEIRQNGDIYLSYNGNDVKLQDLIADIYSKLPTS